MERLVLFAKTPRLYDVKTRLLPALSAEQALALYEAMLTDQIRFARVLGGPDRGCELCTDRPFAPEGELAEAAGGMRVTSQGDGDLGARMSRAFDRAFAEGASRAAILGADAPTLPRRFVEDAFAHLRGGADAVIIPALDGGYVFVGASRPSPELFDGIPWGTPAVADATRRRGVALGLTLAETEPWWDVDVVDDLPRLAAEAAADPTRAPATAAFLARLDLYSPRNPML
jgi:rSAM/selenodomain-associated transferase 1